MAKVKIGDFLKRIKRPITLDPNNEYKLVTVKLHHKGVVLRGIKKGVEIKSKMYQIKEGDFILSGIDARNGAFGIVPKELNDAIVTNDFWYFELDEEIIDKHFFLELTTTSWFDDICRLGSDGTTQRIRLQKDKFFNQVIDLPPLREQQKFIDKFKQLKSINTNLYEEIQTQQILLKKLRQSILQEAIEGKLTAEWRAEHPDVEPASVLLEKIKAEKERLVKEKKIKKQKPLPPISDEEKPFEIPEGWEWCRLQDVANKIHYGFNASAKPEKSDVKLLRITDIQNNTVNWKTVPGCDYLEKDLKSYSLNNNDILIARTGGTIGKSYIVKDINVISLFASYLIRIVPNFKLNADFLKLFFESPFYWKQLHEAAWGAGQPNVNGTSLSKLALALPPIEEQKEIVKKIESLFKICDALEEQIEQSKADSEMLMQAILREAFEG
jgi:restriction endonuclease S subunit